MLDKNTILLKILLIQIVIVLFSGSTTAQNYKTVIRGKVIENEYPVEFANVYITTQTDSIKIIDASITDSLGYFKIENTPYGNYVLNIKSLGYVSRKLDIALNASLDKVDLKTIQLQPDNVVLKSVDVVSYRKSIQRTGQGFVIRASENLTQTTGSAADLLKNMPAVHVDAEGGVTVRGRSPMILINGKASGLIGIDRTAQLERIPAGNIDRIEINNNPSAKYDADAEAGIINIILKTNKESGTTGSFSAGLGYGAKERLNGSAMLNHNTEKYNLGLYYNNWYTVRTRSVDGDRINYNLPENYYLAQRRSDRRKVKNQEMRLTSDYNFNDKNQLSFNAAWAYNEQDNNETLTSTSETQTKGFTSRNTRHSLEIRKFNAFETELNYLRKFDRKEQILTANIISSFDDEKENTDIDVKKLAPDYSQLGSASFEQTKSYQFSNMTTGAVDYKQPVANSGMIETGYKGIYRYLNADYKNLNFVNKEYVIDPLRSNIFKFNEQIHAIYAQYAGWTGSKEQPDWKYDLGLRAEQVFTTGRNTDQTNNIDNNYFHFFPSANLAYYPKADYFYKISYSRRINRPGLGALNPFIDITDSLNQHGGNPHLKPELIHSFELAVNRDWKASSLTFALFYRQNNNSILPYIFSLGNGVYLSKPVNVGDTKNYGFEGIYSFSAFKFWNANLSYSLYKTNIGGAVVNTEIASDVVGWYAKWINNFNLWKDARLQLSANYTSPVAIAQGKNMEVFFVDAGFQEKILKGKGRLGIVFTDALKTQKTGSTTSSKEFYFHRVSKIDSRAILVTFAYSFGTSVSEKLMENKFKNE